MRCGRVAVFSGDKNTLICGAGKFSPAAKKILGVAGGDVEVENLAHIMYKKIIKSFL